ADDRETQWQALIGREAVFDLRGERDAQQADLNTLLELAHTFDNDARRAQIHFLQARLAFARGDYRATAAAAEAALATLPAAGNEATAIRTLGLKTAGLTRMGEMEQARQSAEAALARAECVTDEAALAFGLVRTALYYDEAGDPTRATQLDQRAVELSRRSGDRGVNTLALNNLAVDYIRLGLYRQAHTALEQALALDEALGERRGHAYHLLNLGWVYHLTGDGRTGQRLIARTMGEMTATSDVWGEAACHHYLAEIMEQAQDPARAEQRFAQARQMLDQVGDHAFAMQARAGMARCALALGRTPDALAWATEVWTYIQTQGTGGVFQVFRAFQSIADIFDAAGESEQAHTVVETGHGELIRRANQISDPAWRASFLENIAEHRAIIERREQQQRSML
ncbi:MAG: hypothetical protein WCF84_25985, partial [Anaerolineae bacterium]